MCLILLAWRTHPRFPLVFAGNRDESHDRPTAAPAFWPDAPQVYGGRDLAKGGTWLALSRCGRIAAVTNFRERPAVRNAPRSRGELAAGFVRGTTDARRYLEDAGRRPGDYAAYSLIVGDGRSLYYCSNRNGGIEELPPGVHGLSNHLLNTPWPKIARGKARLAQALASDPSGLTEALFEILLDRTPASDAELPDTGVGLERERELSASFIAGAAYGTRASTVVLVSNAGEVRFTERGFGPGGVATGVSEERFRLETAAPEGLTS
jgi:uncharacterized protein with NRDE domain